MTVCVCVCVCSRPDEFKFGCTSLRVPVDLLHQLRDDITISPNGVVYVKVTPTSVSDDVTLSLSPQSMTW